MNDTVLLFTGIGVFGLMLIAIILTIVEFAQMDKHYGRKSSAVPGNATSSNSERREGGNQA